MDIKNQGPCEILKPDRNGVRKLGIYVNESSGNLFFSTASTATNRIKPKRVYLDDEGYICAEIERRSN